MPRLAPVAVVLLCACAPWKVVQRADPNPLQGQKTISIPPLEWSEILIDGLTEAAWNETNDADMKAEWVVDKKLAEGEFQNGLYGGVHGLQIVPGAAPFTFKCSATYLKTGGFRPLVLTVRAQLIENGRVLDEITLEHKESGNSLQTGQFRKRLLRSAYEAGAGVARYLSDRAEP